MPHVTISEAPRLCGVNRRTLQRAVQAGRLPLTADHRVDTADMGQAGYTVPVAQFDTAPLSHLDTGQSLRTNNVAGYCLRCNAEDVRTRRAARRQREGRT